MVVYTFSTARWSRWEFQFTFLVLRHTEKENKMIQVIESTGPVPEEIAALGHAPAYLIVGKTQGSDQVRADCEQVMRRIYKKEKCIIFTTRHNLPDGRIVYIGQKIDPIVANL